MKKALHLLLYACCLSLSLSLPLRLLAADPYVGYIYPAGIQVGTTNRVVVGGQFFWNVQTGLVSGAGVRVLSVEMVPGFTPPTGDQRKYLVKWLDAIAKGNRETPPLPNVEHLDEWRFNRWWSVLGMLDEGELSIVEHYLYTPRNPLQMSPSLSQRLLVTITADADARPGVREFRVLNPLGISAPRPFIVTTDRHVEEPLYVPPHREQPARPEVAAYPAVLDGQIMPGESDRWMLHLKKGQTITLRTVAREFQPYIGDAVPGFFNPSLRIFDVRGNELAFADDNFFYHPDPVMTFTPPADGAYALDVHDVLYRGREDFVYQITVQEGDWRVAPCDLALWPNPLPTPPNPDACTEYRGTIAAAGAVGCHDFEIVQEGDYVVDVLARRAGSPLDARVTVCEKAGGRTVTVFTDTTNTVHRGSIIQAECDPVGTCHLKAGAYCARIEDEAGKGGAEWTYTVRIRPAQPHFEVWAAKSSISFRQRQGQQLKLSVIRHEGFDGPVRLEESPYFRFSPSVIPAGTNTIKVYVGIREARDFKPMPVEIKASAEINGVRQTVRVQPADEYNQAFAWDHLLPAESFIFKALNIPKDLFQKPPPKPTKKPAPKPVPKKA